MKKKILRRIWDLPWYIFYDVAILIGFTTVFFILCFFPHRSEEHARFWQIVRKWKTTMYNTYTFKKLK